MVLICPNSRTSSSNEKIARINARGGGGIIPAPPETAADEAALVRNEVVGPGEVKARVAAVLVFFFGQWI